MIKNIILIIVESLNSYVINKTVDGHEITPVLNSLIQEEGTIYSLEVKNQISDGISGDGQLIYNSGLLPLDTKATPMTIVPNVDFNPLTANLNNRNQLGVVFADNGMTWNEYDNFQKYGFDSIYTNASFQSEVELRGLDGSLFDFASKLISNNQETGPFFLELVTMSMHIPFADPGAPVLSWLEDSDLPEMERRYSRMTAFFDAELGKFITRLKELGLYENTILVIASDHSINTADTGDHKSNLIPIVFIATNSGHTGHIDKPAGQIDVYPTILDIAGIEAPEFRGVGISLLDSLNNSSQRTKEIRTVSDLILVGNYFGKKCVGEQF